LTFVYTDIITPRSIIRVLHFNGKEKSIQFKNIEYYPLDIWSPNEISILITDSNGYKVPFETSAVSIFVTLHFRRWRRSGL